MKERNRFDEGIHRPMNIFCGVVSWETTGVGIL
jgi:hypothetical protein